MSLETNVTKSLFVIHNTERFSRRFRFVRLMFPVDPAASCALVSVLSLITPIHLLGRRTLCEQVNGKCAFLIGPHVRRSTRLVGSPSGQSPETLSPDHRLLFLRLSRGLSTRINCGRKIIPHTERKRPSLLQLDLSSLMIRIPFILPHVMNAQIAFHFGPTPLDFWCSSTQTVFYST